MPKTPSLLQIHLLSLVVRERSGREVADKYESSTGRSISVSTLYTTFRRMRREGWVTARNGRDNEDARLRYFKVSSDGIAVLNRSRLECSQALKAMRAAQRTLS